MPDCRTGSTGQDRRHLGGTSHRVGVTHQEHAPVNRIKAAGRDAMSDRSSPTQPKCLELLPSGNAVLLCGERRDGSIRGIGGFGMHVMHNPPME
jgi:hypothetical protein